MIAKAMIDGRTLDKERDAEVSSLEQAPSEKRVSEATETILCYLTRDENDVVRVYRRAKSIGYADMTVTVQDGRRVKLWLTEKMR